MAAQDRSPIRGRLGVGRLRRARAGMQAHADGDDRLDEVAVQHSETEHADQPETEVAEVTIQPSSEQERIDLLVPRGFRIAASWSWRLIVIVIMVAGLGWLLRYLSEVTIPIAVAILLAALISPVANWFNRRRFPRALSAALAMIIGVVLVSGTLTLIATQIAGQAEGMGSRVASGFAQLTNWLANGPLHIPEQFLQVDQLTKQVTDFLSQSSTQVAGYAAAFGSQLGHFFAGLAITMFATFYFLYDGAGIWAFLVKLTPKSARSKIDNATKSGWSSLVHYVRATILVAFVDAIGVLIVALILRVPGAPALAALVFLGAFVPLVGAFVSGFVAVFVALVMLGWVQALIMLAGIIAVMQLEGHILQPFLLGRAVKLHPLAVLLGIAIGVIVGGIVGALMSIPLLAFAKTFIQYVATGKSDTVATTVRE
ncbi:AI-2E family transporter [Microlunatus elymi]|uniref:AI-2E family transporter n=1 Tax=Microlunatus elymi TaxID=2596828 RepID=A0A516Q3B0_9ACTN|nr:AI-2E family transporter [Microlunatus elymi]QDP97917.1 AI-2E family transporter [Microlunatus elymi]